MLYIMFRCISLRDALRPADRSRRPIYPWLKLARVVAAVTVLSASASAQTARHESQGYFKLGTTWPTIDATTADYPGAGAALTLDPSRLTLPHVAVGWTAGPMMLEASYRKLGVLQFARTDGTVDGNTHSNALQLAVLPFTLRRRVLSLSPRLGVQAIRTIQTLDARAPDWPYVGNVNTWRVLPAVGLDVTVAVSDHWGVGVTYEPVFGRLGTANDTGRYRQQFLGVDLVYRRRK